MGYAQLLLLTTLLCSASIMPHTIQKPTALLTSTAAGLLGALQYYYMHRKEYAKHREQDALINQLILDQPIDPVLRESLRSLIRRCSKEIRTCSIKKNLAVLPLLVCAAGLGYTFSSHKQTPQPGT